MLNTKLIQRFKGWNIRKQYYSHRQCSQGEQKYISGVFGNYNSHTWNSSQQPRHFKDPIFLIINQFGI